jgi:murein DD-endopeptidase MepM/ murein hydrolase activator NlpD
LPVALSSIVLVAARSFGWALALVGWLLAAGCTAAVAQLEIAPTPAGVATRSAPRLVMAPTNAVPLPQVTSPSPTSTAITAPTSAPAPTPTRLPPHIAAAAVPNPGAQGHVLAVRVTTSDSMTVTATLDHRTVALYETSPHHYWAPIGISALAELGDVRMTVQAFDAAGREIQRRFAVEITDGGYATENIVLSPETAALLDPALVQAERERLEALWKESSSRQQWRAAWQTPGGTDTTSAFGTRRSYNGGPTTDFHAGQDFHAAKGEPVFAPAAGVVALAEPLHVRGNTVWLDHGLGVFSGYFHLSEIDVEVGQRVKPGDLLGRVGSTGLSTGPHLHWEVRIDGVAVDPLEWIERYIGHPDSVHPNLRSRELEE